MDTPATDDLEVRIVRLQPTRVASVRVISKHRMHVNQDNSEPRTRVTLITFDEQ